MPPPSTPHKTPAASSLVLLPKFSAGPCPLQMVISFPGPISWAPLPFLCLQLYGLGCTCSPPLLQHPRGRLAPQPCRPFPWIQEGQPIGQTRLVWILS